MADQFINYEQLYKYRFLGVNQERRSAVWGEIAQYLYEKMGMPSRVLDPAAGKGEFINAIPATERWAVDFVDHTEQHAPGVISIVSDIFEADLPSEYFDGVFVSNFLEHLPSQERVAECLQRLGTFMQPGGRITILGPNFKYCYRDYFDCADHLLALTHVSIAEHLYASGYDLKIIIPRFLPFSFRGLLPPSPTLTRAYLRFPPLWRVLGEQFLLIAEKGRPQT